MKHDFRSDPDSEQASEFLDWLEAETISGLKRGFGDWEGVEFYVFLYVNRAYEAGVPEKVIGDIFGRSLVRAGYGDAEIETALDILEFFADTAREVHQPR